MNYGEYLQKVRLNKPIIHNITNYVTANDVANVELAIGARPIMSDDENEVNDLVSNASGLNINIGTLNEKSIDAMIEAGKCANKLNIPVVLDPVGVCASKYRIDVTKYLIQHFDVDVVKGNASEINTFFNWDKKKTCGVDVCYGDAVTKDNYKSKAIELRDLALKHKCIIAQTGEVDLITDGIACYAIFNGQPEMTLVTGLGCLLSGITAACVSCAPENNLNAVVAAVASMGISGEIALSNLLPNEGNATYRNRIIDALYNLTPSEINSLIKIEEIYLI